MKQWCQAKFVFQTDHKHAQTLYLKYHFQVKNVKLWIYLTNLMYTGSAISRSEQQNCSSPNTHIELQVYLIISVLTINSKQNLDNQIRQ